MAGSRPSAPLQVMENWNYYSIVATVSGISYRSLPLCYGATKSQPVLSCAPQGLGCPARSRLSRKVSGVPQGLVCPAMSWVSHKISGVPQGLVCPAMSWVSHKVSGVSQGECIRTFVFIIYINDLPDCISHSECQ